MNDRRAYARDQSPLYRIKSPAQLAEKLCITRDQLRLLETSGENYIRWVDEKKTGRPIQQPKPLLETVHKRVCRLLSRIETPDFLHSAIKGRSYISNAMRHSASQATAKIDVQQFYPSTRVQAIFHFFRDRMNCNGDVSGILAKLLTVDGHLATGSSASPILSFFAYEDMFLELEALAIQRNCEMTCYIDDVVFTGPGATRRLIYDSIKIIHRYRLHGHKTKLFNAGQPKVITGVAITRRGARLPNKRQKLINDDVSSISGASDDDMRIALMRSAVGRLYEAAQIDRSWTPKAKAMAIKKRCVERRLLLAKKIGG